jgi:hypothetical protein
MICSFQGDCNWDSPFLKYPQLALLPMQNSTRAKKKDDKKREDRRRKKKKKQKKEEEGRGLSIVLHCIIM